MDFSGFNLNYFRQLNQDQKKQFLLIAIHLGLTEEVSAFMKAGANIESKDKDGNTPLLLAAMYGRTTIVELLLTAKANVDAVNQRGNTPLLLASEYGHFEIVNRLLQAKANQFMINDNGENALHVATTYHHRAIAFRLYSSMSNRQIDIATLTKPMLKETASEYRKAILNFQKRLFNIFWPLIIETDHKKLSQPILPLKIMALQLSLMFPRWYAHRIKNDLDTVWGIMRKMRERNKIPKITISLEAQLSDLSIQAREPVYLPSFSNREKQLNRRKSHPPETTIEEKYEALTAHHRKKWCSFSTSK